MLRCFSLIVSIVFCFFLTDAQTLVTLRIDPGLARGGTATQVFDSIQFVPLETTKESLFGTVDQLECTDSLFFILDIQSRSILLFSVKGKFKTRITSGGFDKYFGRFALNRAAREVMVANNFANGLLIYDFDGKLLRKEIAPEGVQSLFYFGKNKYLYNLGRPFNPGENSLHPYDLALSNGYNAVFKELNPYNPNWEDGHYNIYINPLNYSGIAGSCMFSLPFNYNVYQVNDTGIVNRYQFVFPQTISLPPNFDRDSSFKGHRAENVYGNPEYADKISGIQAVYKVNDYLLFSAVKTNMNFGADWNYLYNLKTGNLLSFARVTPDSSSCFFPLASTVIEKIEATNAGYLYSSLPAFRLFTIKTELNKNVEYPPALSTFLANGTKKDNPVIVRFKLKPTL